jgi:hypothetical protein
VGILDYKSWTPLSYAVENMHEAMVEILIHQSKPRSFLKSAVSQYLGGGHLWPESIMSNEHIVKALNDVGITDFGNSEAAIDSVVSDEVAEGQEEGLWYIRLRNK